jgi:DNA-binding NarL/FixJ family response regulator
MTLRYRHMRNSDIKGCVSSLSENPSYGPQYGGDTESLIKSWTLLDGLDAFRAVVFEEVIGNRVRLLGPGVCVVVTEEFSQEMKNPPFFWLGPELASRIAAGRSPVLTNNQLRTANTTVGVHLVAWPNGPSPEDSARMDINHLYMSTFMELVVRGYRVKELYFQTPIAEAASAVLQWGAGIATQDGLRTGFSSEDIQDIVKQPYVLVMNEQLAASRFGSWASGLFVMQEPQIGFSRREQRLLEEALRGGTDDELARELEVSLSAVKKCWRSIYERVERSTVNLLTKTRHESDLGDRGKGKKHPLLGYVREHPEELRPISKRLLRQAQQDAGSKTTGQPPTRRRVGRPRSSRP